MASDDHPTGSGTRSLKDHLAVGVPAVLVLAAGFLVASNFVEPPPPNRIVIATGGKSGAYHAFAERYREILARDGIELVVRETTGSVHNITLLDDPASGVDLAFVQGGTGDAAASPRLISLASLYYEPIWLFTRPSLFGPDRLRALAGKRVAAGPKGSGTRAVARLLLDEVGVTGKVTLSPLGGRRAAEALRANETDAAFIVAGPTAASVRAMFAGTAMNLMSIRLRDALVLRHRFLSQVRLPKGAIDPARDQPPDDVVLLAPTAGLVVRDGFHPALIELVLRAAGRVHRDGGLFEAPGEFPAGKHLDFPLADEARRYLRSGPGLLQRYLPFWVANFLDRTKVMLVPLLTLLIPVVRILPPAYKWRMRSKIIRWYKDLARLEGRLKAVAPEDDVRPLVAELDRIEADVRDMDMPPGYLDSVYSLRLHIDVVRSRLAGESAAPDSAANG
jgi:TRAP transporter TAXI family solute receptor